jgi:GNAT superfamily N-acetyltransferase
MSDIIVTDAIPAGTAELLGEGLGRYNDAVTGYADRRPLAVLLRDPAGAVLGGAIGRSSLGMAFLEMFHLPETHRRGGWGSRILAAFEAEARARGCRHATLTTLSFQAPRFYEKHGWVRFGEIPCDPPGSSRVFLRKAL